MNEIQMDSNIQINNKCGFVICGILFVNSQLINKKVGDEKPETRVVAKKQYN